MITKEQMMPLLLEVCPSFSPKWNEFLEEWNEDENDLPHYLCLGDFARHLIDMLNQGNTKTFPQIFDAIERLHSKGDHYVKEAVIVGLLEGI